MPRRLPALSVALLLTVLLAVPASAQYRIPSGYSSEVIQVKLEEGSSPSRIQTVIPPSLRSETARVRPLFTVDPRRLVQLQEQGRRAGRNSKNLSLWFEVRLRPGTDAAAFVAALRAVPGIEAVEPAPLPAPPPGFRTPLTASPPFEAAPPALSAAHATTPSFVANQGYLGEATDGIDAEFAWTIPGGNGAGVTIYDIEYSWNQTHEDLSAVAGVVPLVDGGDSGVDPFSSTDHGTAVLGEVIADNDAVGVTGISWGAGIGLAPANTANLGYNLANAIALAMADGAAGDVILIEQQTCVCGIMCPGGGSQLGLGPSEWVQSVFDAVEAATAAGFVVVAAAGNGSVDLDQAGCNSLFDRTNRDSGALIVGAGAAPGSSDRERLGFSSYGSRVDVQGWGQSVWTTGYGDGYVDPDDPTNPDRWYDNSFGGTSSASPIVTGAVADLQGIRAANGFPFFSSTDVRELLVDTGSPQLGDTGEHIGPRPDLRSAIASFLSLPPTADAGPDQTVECASTSGTSVTLDGSGSEDLNGDPLTYTWRENGNQIATGAMPTVTLAEGTHTIELTVDDGQGGTDTDTVVITVEDTTPPVVTLVGPSELTLECHVDAYVEQGATADDLCEGGLPVTISGTVDTHTPGVYVLTYTATDGSGNVGSATRTVTVVDTTPPEIVVNASPLTLWPPNHAYRSFSLADFGVEASDLCDESLSAADVVIASVTSDEAEDAQGPGDGSTLNDIVIDGSCGSAALRAERARAGNGRVYTLFLEAVDGSGNVGTATTEVHVPPNQSHGIFAIANLPALYSVEGCEPVAPVRIAATRDAASPGAGEAPVVAQAGVTVPAEYRLGQNYPNPFSADTRIPFALPQAGEALLKVYDLLGREVRVLFTGSLPAGVHEVTFSAAGLPHGLYFYRLAVADRVLTGRMLLH